MNKYSKNIGIILLGLSFFSSCTREIDDLFDQSAAQRLDAAKNKAYNTLISAPNGWEMRYFANENSPGYILLMNFESNTRATIAGKNPAVTGNNYKSDQSAWDVIGDNGPVLTFNTYNSVLHPFADPQDDGTGLGGDYEFIIMNVTDNELELKGKKTGTYITMSKLYSSQNWEEYYDLLTDIDNYLFNSTVNLELKDAGNTCFTLSNSTSHIFTVIPYGTNESDEEINLEYIPFIVFSDGIAFNQSFEINGKSVRNFKLNENKTKLISMEFPDVEIMAEDVYLYFIKGLAPYYTTAQDLSGNFLTAFSAMEADFNQVYSGRRDLQNIGFYKRDNTFAFMLNTTSNQALYNIPAAIIDNKLVISDFDAYNMPDSEMDTNARLFYNAVPAIKEILSLLPGTYNLESKSPFNLNIIELSSTSNTGDKMLLSR